MQNILTSKIINILSKEIEQGKHIKKGKKRNPQLTTVKLFVAGAFL